jgi:hypothetical protein
MKRGEIYLVNFGKKQLHVMVWVLFLVQIHVQVVIRKILLFFSHNIVILNATIS